EVVVSHHQSRRTSPPVARSTRRIRNQAASKNTPRQLSSIRSRLSQTVLFAGGWSNPIARQCFGFIFARNRVRLTSLEKMNRHRKSAHEPSRGVRPDVP